MKKSELFESIQVFVTKHIENELGGDHHAVVIPTSQNENISIVGHFGKRGIEGVYVAVEDEMHVYQYDVTNTIIEHESKEWELYKESSFNDPAVAVQSMYDTVLSATSNIAELLETPYKALMEPDAPVNFELTDRADFAF